MNKHTPLQKFIKKLRKINPKRYNKSSFWSFKDVEKEFGIINALTWIKGRKLDKKKNNLH